MMENPNLVKVEWLMTRNCNLKCQGCKVIKPDFELGPEMTLEQKKKAIKIIYDDLDVKFLAVYGGEPLSIGVEELGDIIEELNKYRPEKSYTIISNSIGLTDEKIDYLLGRGLDSWTASVDCLPRGITYDKYSEAKSNTGLDALLRFKKRGLRDVCGIVTVTKKNISEVVETVRFMTDRGIWAGIDLIHYDSTARLNGMDNFSVMKDEMEGLTFNDVDIFTIREVADELIRMKKDGALIFPTYKTLEGWKNPQYSINLNWSCKEFGRPYMFMMDTDGSLGCCDQFNPPEIRKYSIFDMPDKWWDFALQYMDSVEDRNCRCFWSTHYCLKEIQESEGGVKYYQHEKENEQL